MARTLLRVPREDWARLKVWDICEFRVPERKPGFMVPKCRERPTPAVAYAETQAGVYDSFLLAVVERRLEPVFCISDDGDGIARSGFDSYEEFMRHWRARSGGVYRPMEMVNVYWVRPWLEHDDRVFASELLHKLYGDWLPPEP